MKGGSSTPYPFGVNSDGVLQKHGISDWKGAVLFRGVLISECYSTHKSVLIFNSGQVHNWVMCVIESCPYSYTSWAEAWLEDRVVL